MADATEQIAGILPTVIVGGVAVKMTQSLFGSPQQSKRGRKGKKSNRKSASPWSGNPMARGAGSSPW